MDRRAVRLDTCFKLSFGWDCGAACGLPSPGPCLCRLQLQQMLLALLLALLAV